MLQLIVSLPFCSQRLSYHGQDKPARSKRFLTPSRQGVQASNPLAVAAPVREGSAPVGSDQLVRLLEGGAAEGPLQQTNGDDLRIGKARRIVVGASPGRLCGMLLEIIVHEDIDLGHLVGDGRGYTVHRGSYPFVELDIPRYNFAPIGVVPGYLY